MGEKDTGITAWRVNGSTFMQEGRLESKEEVKQL